MQRASATQLELLKLLELQVERQRLKKAEIEATRPAWTPRKENKPQCAAFESDAYIIGYGGAAGGGKTSTATGKALMQHQNTLFVRNTALELEGVTSKLKDIAPGWLNSVKGIWVPRPEARKKGVKCRKIKFTYLDKEKDIGSKQGIESDLIVFEEAANLKETHCRELMTWLRSTDPNQVCQAFFTWNPPRTPEGMWIVKMFAPWIDPDHHMFPVESGTVLHVAMFGNDEVFSFEPKTYTHDPRNGTLLEQPQETRTRVFFRALVTDNPDLAGTDYVKNLLAQPEHLRRMYLYGEMDASLVDKAGKVVRQSPYKAAKMRWQEIVATNDPRHLPPTVLSIDLAEGGDDNSVITPIYHGGFAGDQHIVAGSKIKTPFDNVRELEEYVRIKWGCSLEQMRDARGAPTVIVYDGIGTAGGGFGAAMSADHPDCDLRKFVGSNAAGVRGVYLQGEEAAKPNAYAISTRSGLPANISGGNAWANRISAAWGRFGQMLESPHYALAVPPSISLQSQITSREFAASSNNDVGKNAKLAIESKQLYKDRLNRSPDEADSLVMGYWMLDWLGGEE